ncbi:MAG TPA: trypsin-like peptidase domain-containing protein [Ktedonobacteraceae bacterium]|nr:trypsin-like peptidase domain-containing protein [Ktedonobacteraceae bacterium]
MQHPYDDEQSIPYQPEQGQVATHDQNASNAPTIPTIPASPQQDYAGEYPIFSQQPPPDHSAGYPNYPQQPPPDNPNSYPNLSQQPPRRTSGGVRAGAIFLLTLLLAVVFGVGLFSGWQYGRSGSVATAPTTGQLQSGASPVATIPPYTSSNIEQVREAVITKVRPTVVQINVTLANGAAIGSGVIIDKRGYIVTNNHVVDGAQKVDVVLFDGTKLSAQVVGTDPADDLAVIKINPPSSNLAVANLADSSKLQVGQDVLAVGNPLGITQTVTNGIVSALNRSVSEGNGVTIPSAIQTDAPINPGNSGGALVDMQGNLVGIPTLAAIDPQFNTPASGVGFAIPSNRVSFIVPQIIASGHVTHTGRAALGVRVTSVDANLAAQDNLSVDHGVLIVDVVANGAAAQAHLQAGDVIVQIGNEQVTDVSSLGDVLVTKNPGDTVAVHIYRGNQQMTLNVTLGELQAG